MTPEAARGALDRALKADGEDVILRRITGKQRIPFDVAVRARVRNFSPDELVGGIVQGDSQVILSPSEIEARQWPGPPRQNDLLIAAGRTRTVVAVTPFRLAGRLVRLELTVRG